MASDESIPSFLSLQPRARKAKSRNVTSARASVSAAAPQLSFDLALAFVAPPVASLPPTSAPLEPILYTVRQLIAELRQHLEGAYTGILNVEGEVSNLRPAASGHIYFTLKDGDAQLPVVLFRRQAQLLGFKLRDGLAVEVRGRISVYETRGQLQLIAETVRPRGTGALQLAFEQLRDRLRREGLFDRPRTLLPPFPHCIGIITAPSGAAIRDIIQVVRRRHARLNLLIYPAIMQGAQCANTVSAGIRWFNRNPERVNLILLARGGGSLEDLAGFNDEALARTIAASKLPIVSAIGHEIDHTIADFVSDLRAPTPSAAAELITAAQHRIEERIVSLERRVLRAGDYQLLRARQRLARLSANHVLARLRDSIGLRQQRIDELQQRLLNAASRLFRERSTSAARLEARLRRHDPTVRLTLAQRRFTTAHARLNRIGGDLTRRKAVRLERATLRLEALSPLAVLKRGYAIVYLEHEDASAPTLLRNAADAHPGQQIVARLASGSARAVILETTLETP